ncbi:MAG: cysteine desulfurase CsdA [Epsilonproteobacteria bacterium]|nr:cysteine desulfurase CsdA [Campylobacterota bacterium]|tara:strand:- start:37 stop:1260 length:1224 start_codon:yes stop_codon:yes gene_type:complete
MSKNGMNIKELKKQFPIFEQKVNGYPLIYLDSVSTAQMPQIVIDAIVDYYSRYKSNVGRGVYTSAERATIEFEQARAIIAQFIGAKKQEIVITSGATDGINLVARAWAQQHIGKGDEIIVSEIEHHSNFVVWQQLAIQKGAILKIVPVNNYGVIDIETFKTYLSDKTKLVAMIYTSNMLGTTNDVTQITQASHAVGAKVLIDATQSVVHLQVDVKKINCDFLVFSGHKLFGPTGVGVLYLKEALFNQCDITKFGGGMVYSVTDNQTSFKKVPHCFEAGTQPVAQVIGLAAAIQFIQKNVTYEQLQQYETSLIRMLAQELQTIDGITIISHVPQKEQFSNLITFVSDKYHAHDIAAHLDQYGIAVRAGHHCVQPYHQKVGINASVRVSVALYTTEQDIYELVKILKEL